RGNTRERDDRESSGEVHRGTEGVNKALREGRSRRIHAVRFSAERLESAGTRGCDRGCPRYRGHISIVADAGGNALPQRVFSRDRSLRSATGWKLQRKGGHRPFHCLVGVRVGSSFHLAERLQVGQPSKPASGSEDALYIARGQT